MSWRGGESRPFVIGGGLTPAVRGLLMANVSVFLFTALAQTLAHVRIDRFFGLVPYEVIHHLFLWQLVTYMFLHADILHIGMNMLALWMFGGELEELWGTKRFLRFYFVTGIGAGICAAVVTPNSYIVTIGASGAIYGLLAAYGILFPDRTVLLYFLIPVRARVLIVILFVLTFWSSLSASGGGIAHVAHLGGMIFGWLYLRGPRWPTIRGIPGRDAYERWRRDRLRRKFKVYYDETRGGDRDSEE